MVVLSLVLAACGSDSFPLAAKLSTTSTSPRAAASTPTSGPGAVDATATSAAPSAAASSTSPAPSSTSAPATTSAPGPSNAAASATTGVPASAPPAPQLARAGSAGQAIVVTASGYGVNTATLTAYERRADGWQKAYGPYSARIGFEGFAPPDEKREGDGRTPSGVYGFDFFFGVSANPGVKFAYRQITPSIVWVDDPKSPLYNQWVDADQQNPGEEPEPMYQPIAYAYGAVIAYNTARTPGLGSAIFLHATIGGPTAGCVSIPVGQLVEILRWLDPAQSPRIIMGVG